MKLLATLIDTKDTLNQIKVFRLDTNSIEFISLVLFIYFVIFVPDSVSFIYK